MMSVTRNATIALALILPGAAFAAADPASVQFAKDVEQKCGEATADIFRKSQIAVDPTGTQSYGVAIVYGRSKEAKGPAAVICVMDKKTGKVEIGAELGKDVIRVRKPKAEGQDDNAKQTNKKMNGNSAAQDDMQDDEQ
ncbi:MAG: hypothetical protein JWM58_1965 [Rhizobium sp.]|nr:hypothetical protein [Rhizobium sp.]